MTSEVARASRFEGTALPDDPAALFLDFDGVWATAKE